MQYMMMSCELGAVVMTAAQAMHNSSEIIGNLLGGNMYSNVPYFDEKISVHSKVGLLEIR